MIVVKVLNLVVRGASKSFTAECNALRDIRHKNLVKIMSVCEIIDFQGNYSKAIVYEFKANGSLYKWLYYNGEQEQETNATNRNLGFIQRLDIAIHVSQELEYLHCGTDSVIVHGDLKSSNILLVEDMTAFVGDSVLSKIISSKLPMHESSITIGTKGTFRYLPPGDVYSYGILVLELFTNRRPTDDSFNDHVNLRNFVSAALPDSVTEVADPLIQIGSDMDNTKIEHFLASDLPPPLELLDDGINQPRGVCRNLGLHVHRELPPPFSIALALDLPMFWRLEIPKFPISSLDFRLRH
ncbi:hypothetical protein MIMGU_mgv11b024614mg [Erythranthe guttata]|uniref:Protein kinase domain-containing protein n=1 Tax=Erythranthe guttata TaxID=4155 RepID=A0A022PSN2_ERYGU|nr:hypothetical protein MIMGU_mgv11b024614mg [Erythranthe guttata]